MPRTWQSVVRLCVCCVSKSLNRFRLGPCIKCNAMQCVTCKQHGKKWKPPRYNQTQNLTMEKSQSKSKCLHRRIIITSHSKSNYKHSSTCEWREKEREKPAIQLHKVWLKSSHVMQRMVRGDWWCTLVTLNSSIFDGAFQPKSGRKWERERVWLHFMSLRLCRTTLDHRRCYRKLKSPFSSELVLNHSIETICMCIVQYAYGVISITCNNFGS